MKHKLTQRMAGLGGIYNPFVANCSGPRAGMTHLEIGQAIAIARVDPPTIWGGYNDELAHYTFDAKVPADCLVVSVHRKYNSVVNPLTVVIYQDINTGEYGVIEVSSYWCEHQYFGSMNRPTPALLNLMSGQRLDKGTYLNRSARVTKDGIYSTTISCNTVTCTDPNVTEDGYVVDEEFVNSAAITTIRKYLTQVGRKEYFLNSYGTEEVFMPFQALGGNIRDDGVVFSTHAYDELDVYRLTPKGLLKNWMGTATPTYINDTFIPEESQPTIIDITVERGGSDSKRNLKTPENMRKQLDYYADEFNRFNESIVDIYDRVISKDKGGKMTPELNDTIYSSLCKCDISSPYRTALAANVKKLYNKYSHDEYRVEITVKLTKKLERGAKMAGCSGDKGVICSIRPSNQMPRNADGTVASVLKMTKGAISRANPSQNIGGYIGAACRDYSNKVRKYVNDGVPTSVIFEELLDFYDCIDVNIRKFLLSYDEKSRIEHINLICKSRIIPPINVESETNPLIMILKLEKSFPPTRGRVQYMNTKGEWELSKNEVLIEVQDYMVLEQSYINPSVMGSSSSNIYGLPAKPSKPLKYIRPIKIKPTANVSETEHRLYLAIMGPEYENLLELAGNPDKQRAMIQTILKSSTPSEIESVVNRIDCESSGHRALKILTHVLAGVGLEITKVTQLTEGKYD